MSVDPLNPFRIEWNRCGRSSWERLFAACERSNLSQSWSYAMALTESEGGRADLGVIRFHTKPVGLVQVRVEPLLKLFAVCKIHRGPLWIHDKIPGEMQRLVLGLLRRRYGPRRGRLLMFHPELDDTPEHRDRMARSGFRRRQEGYSTVWLDLTKTPQELRRAFKANWRNRLSQAERHGLEWRIDRGGAALEWLLGVYEEDRTARAYPGPSPALLRALREHGRGDDFLVLRAFDAGQALAGILLLRHGRAATYLVGWNGAEGRRRRAHHLLLWQGLLALRRDGTRWLDLGGFNLQGAAGIATFKLGLGGAPVTLVGGYR